VLCDSIVPVSGGPRPSPRIPRGGEERQREVLGVREQVETGTLVTAISERLDAGECCQVSAGFGRGDSGLVQVARKDERGLFLGQFREQGSMRGSTACDREWTGLSCKARYKIGGVAPPDASPPQSARIFATELRCGGEGARGRMRGFRSALIASNASRSPQPSPPHWKPIAMGEPPAGERGPAPRAGDAALRFAVWFLPGRKSGRSLTYKKLVSERTVPKDLR
jgi:hypothetical protein